MGNCCSEEEEPKSRRGRSSKEKNAYENIKRVHVGSSSKEGGTSVSGSYVFGDDILSEKLPDEDLSEIARLSRAESISKMTNEPSNLMITLRRKFIVTKALLQHGINDDIDQFRGDIKESIADMRDKDRRRVKEWLDSVQRALRGRKPSEFPPIPPPKMKKSKGEGGSGSSSAFYGRVGSSASVGSGASGGRPTSSGRSPGLRHPSGPGLYGRPSANADVGDESGKSATSGRSSGRGRFSGSQASTASSPFSPAMNSDRAMSTRAVGDDEYSPIRHV